MTATRGLSMVLLLAASQAAQAATYAVTAPINNNVDPKLVLGAHQLMASELDFQDGVSGVTDIEESPSSLTNACLSSTSCLKGIASSAGTERLITGAMAPQGPDIALDLLMYDVATNKIVRRNTWTVANDPSALADKLTPILKELLTGEGSGGGGGAAVAAGGGGGGSGFKADDDFAFDEGGGKSGDPEVDDLMAIDSLEDLDEPEERDNAAAAAAALPAAAAGAAVGAAAGAAAGAASQATGGAVSDDDVLSMISFGGGATPTNVGQAAGGAATAAATNAVNNQLGAASGMANSAIDNAVANVPSTGNKMADKMLGGAAAKAAEKAKGLVDLDAEKVAKAAGGGGGSVREEAETISIAVRGGVSTYYKFEFITGGAEIGVGLPPVPGLQIVAGLEMYMVQRALPPSEQLLRGQIYEWNQIYPMNLGALYRLDIGSAARPYFGADGIMVQYYADEIGGDWAGGARARAGLDYFLTPNIGLNVNLAAGMWSGQNWPLIEPGVGASGLLPQASAGLIAAF